MTIGSSRPEFGRWRVFAFRRRVGIDPWIGHGVSTSSGSQTEPHFPTLTLCVWRQMRRPAVP